MGVIPRRLFHVSIEPLALSTNRSSVSRINACHPMHSPRKEQEPSLQPRRTSWERGDFDWSRLVIFAHAAGRAWPGVVAGMAIDRKRNKNTQSNTLWLQWRLHETNSGQLEPSHNLPAHPPHLRTLGVVASFFTTVLRTIPQSLLIQYVLTHSLQHVTFHMHQGTSGGL